MDNTDHTASWFARYFKPVFTPTKNKNFNFEFYNSTENAYHYQHWQISIYVDSTLTQANQMFYISLQGINNNYLLET